MNIIYPMIIFVFVFGSAVTFLNDSGMYGTHIPTTGAQVSLDQAREISSSLEQSSTASGFSYTEQLSLLGKSLFGGVLAVLSLGFLLKDLGIPISLVGFLISPLGIAVAFWLVEMWLGRSVE